MESGNVGAKFAEFSEHWRLKVAAGLNGQEVRLDKVQGFFPWHFPQTEEIFEPADVRNTGIVENAIHTAPIGARL